MLPFCYGQQKSQSPARYRLAAKASAVQTGLRKCPCLARVLGSHRQRSHRGRAGGSARVGQRELPRAVADTALPDVDAQFEKFAVDARCTPTGILPAHLPRIFGLDLPVACFGENYVGKLTPMRSNISRFSRGTDGKPKVTSGETQQGLVLSRKRQMQCYCGE